MNDGDGKEAANEEEEYEERERPTKRKACQVRQCKKNKSNVKCYKCQRIVCGKCTGKGKVKVYVKFVTYRFCGTIS